MTQKSQIHTQYRVDLRFLHYLRSFHRSFFVVLIKKHYLCIRNFGGIFSGREKILKRESGANPEQTRCCELYSIKN